MDLIYDQLMADYGAVTFEPFINLLVNACFHLVFGIHRLTDVLG